MYSHADLSHLHVCANHEYAKSETCIYMGNTLGSPLPLKYIIKHSHFYELVVCSTKRYNGRGNKTGRDSERRHGAKRIRTVSIMLHMLYFIHGSDLHLYMVD